MTFARQRKMARLYAALAWPVLRDSRPSADYSLTKATRLLGYKPEVDLDEGMRRCEIWLREQGMLS